MTYKVKVSTMHSAYSNAGRFIIKTFGYENLGDIFRKMEAEFNLTNIPGTRENPDDHCFEFRSKNDYLMFMLKWS